MYCLGSYHFVMPEMGIKVHVLSWELCFIMPEMGIMVHVLSWELMFCNA